MATRIGVDVGGTFTDLVFYDDATGEVRVAKGSTTTGEPDRGVVNTVQAGVPKEKLPETSFFLHGTTVGINALLERKGSVVGLLTTAGFRDVLAMRRGTRGEQMYDPLYQAEPELVPRRLRQPVVERMRADGTVDTPLDPAGIADALEVFEAAGVETVAVCFINAYANPQHEVEAEQELRRLGFEGEISLGHKISREYREYERTSTVVVDAYVRASVSSYLGRLETSLGEQDFSGDCLITRSGGGSLSFEEASSRPFETIMSGPVAGAMGAGELCRALGLKRAITADVGGTSFDSCFIVDGRPSVKYEGIVGDMPLQTAWVDVRSIGSGGGSVAYTDRGGALRVGPESAGAVPGPVCYGRGGTNPTTTDAAATLGMLAFGELADGVVLDREAAAQAIEELGGRCGLDRDATASGILTIATAAMADTIRSVSIEEGEDPRDAALIAFGGAGPLFATLLAEELDIKTVVVPGHAGNFSAWGMLGQDITRDASVTAMSPLDEEGVAGARRALDSLFEELDQRETQSTSGVETSREASLDIRYSEQESTLTVDWTDPDGDDAAALTERFTTMYQRTFGHVLDGPVEIVSVRAASRAALPRRRTERASANGAAGRESRTIEAYSFTQGERMPFTVVDRAALGAGGPAAGPMIVLEPTTTTYIDVGYGVRVGDADALIIEKAEVSS
jgi:N-methylhydantoinase A